MKSTRTLVCLVVSCLLGVGLAEIASGQTLKWQLSAGSNWQSTLVQTTQVTSEVDPKINRVDNELTIRMTWQVVSAAPDAIVIDQTVDGLKIETTSQRNGKMLVVDTQDPDPKPTRMEKDLAAQLQPLIGVKFTVTLNPRGEVVEVAVPEDKLEAWRQLPGAQQLRSLFTPAGLKQLYGQSMVVLPEGEVNTGHRWEKRLPIRSPLGVLERVTRYELKPGKLENERVIEFETSVTTVEPANDKTRIIRFAGSGEILWDAKAGRPLQSEVRTDIQTERPYRDQTIATRVETTVQLTLEEKVAKENGEGP